MPMMSVNVLIFACKLCAREYDACMSCCRHINIVDLVARTLIVLLIELVHVKCCL